MLESYIFRQIICGKLLANNRSSTIVAGDQVLAWAVLRKDCRKPLVNRISNKTLEKS